MTGYDTVVAGSGIAGLTVAAELTERGQRVLVVEKATQLGGSTALSGGTVWTAASMAAMADLVPGGDRCKQEHLVDGIADGLAWLRDVGVDIGETRRPDERVVSQIDPVGLVRRLSSRVGAGGDVATGTGLVGVGVGEGGHVAEAVVRSETQEWRIPARDVVLATGGFQGSPALVRRHLGIEAGRMILRSNPDSRGDGLRAGLAAGGRCTPDMRSFYGHTIPVTPAPLRWDEWTSVTPYYSQDAVLVDLDGMRFFDESTSMADERAPMAMVRRPRSRAFLVFDDAIHSDVDLPGRSRARVGTSFAASVAAGAPTVTADTLPALAAGMARWGVDEERLIDTLRSYNAAMAASDDPTPPRTRHRFAVEHPPFRAMAVQPAITFTLGGLDVDDRYRVRSGTGVVPGVWAIGADAGGVYEGGYAGGLVLGLVQGRRVARDIAR